MTPLARLMDPPWLLGCLSSLMVLYTSVSHKTENCLLHVIYLVFQSSLKPSNFPTEL